MTFCLAFKQSARRLGAYDLLTRLGAHGAATMYKGRNCITGELAVLKVVPAKVRPTLGRQQNWDRQFRALKALEHPHLVRTLNYGRHKGWLYLAVEFVEGHTLSQWLAQTVRMDEIDLVRIAVQAARALNYLHMRKMVHGSVCPKSILLSNSGDIKLTDMGLIKGIENCGALVDSHPCLSGEMANYVAPELFGGGHADVRCDIYGLAATLYRAATGAAPFDSRNPLGIYQKKIKNQVRAPRQLAPLLSQQLEWALLKALSAEPAHRPVSCGDFLANLFDRGTGERCERQPVFVANRTAPGHFQTYFGMERRAHRRTPCNWEGTCRLLGEAEEIVYPVHVQDISFSGVCLMIERRFEPGTLLQLLLPENDNPPCPEPMESVDRKRAKPSPMRSLTVRVVRVKAHSSGKWITGCVVSESG